MVFTGRQKCLNLLNFLNYRKNFALDGQSFSSVTLPKACLVMKLLLRSGKNCGMSSGHDHILPTDLYAVVDWTVYM